MLSSKSTSNFAVLALFQNEGYVQLATTDKLRPYIQSEPVLVQKEKSPADDLSFRVVRWQRG